MESKQPLYICGAIVLVVILLIGAFSLGVYVGRYGLSREGLVYGGPGGQPQPPGQRPQGQPQAQPGQPVQPDQNPQPGDARPPIPPGKNEPPQAVGRILNILEDGIEIATGEGPRPILFTGDTIIQDFEGNAFSLSDLETGMVVVIYGQFDPDQRNFIAREVYILPQKEPD